MARFAVLALCLAPAASVVYFEETFDDASWTKRWVESTEWKPAGEMGTWELTPGAWYDEAAKDVAMGIQTSEDMRFYGLSAKMPTAATTVDKPLVVQFTVKHEEKEYAFCGGGYIKLLPGDVDQKKFGGDTDYSIMFGPDLCGYDVSRVHLIFTHEGENLLKDDEIKLDYSDKDEFTHLYTLILKPDGEYVVELDGKEKSSGKIEDGWKFPKKEVKDPAVSKPEDWVDTKKIQDPAAVKPEGYDDISAEIPDPEAEQPEDWDTDEDGEWEAPMIDNPEYKGEWKAPMIDNPDYKGEWVHPVIANAEYKPETYAKYASLTTVGFELWTVNKGSIFDNILVTDDVEYAKEMAKKTFEVITKGEKDAKDAHKKSTEPADDADDDADEDAHDEL